jgi:hypothetical protein
MKRIILWDHERGSWQYDVFCLLIIAFIFLTPNSWFSRTEILATNTSLAAVKHQVLSEAGIQPSKSSGRLQHGRSADAAPDREKSTERSAK